MGETWSERDFLACQEPLSRWCVSECDFLSSPALVLTCANISDSLSRELTIPVRVFRSNNIDNFKDALTVLASCAINLSHLTSHEHFSCPEIILWQLNLPSINVVLRVIDGTTGTTVVHLNVWLGNVTLTWESWFINEYGVFLWVASPRDLHPLGSLDLHLWNLLCWSIIIRLWGIEFIVCKLHVSRLMVLNLQFWAWVRHDKVPVGV